MRLMFILNLLICVVFSSSTLAETSDAPKDAPASFDGKSCRRAFLSSLVFSSVGTLLISNRYQIEFYLEYPDLVEKVARMDNEELSRWFSQMVSPAKTVPPFVDSYNIKINHPALRQLLAEKKVVPKLRVDWRGTVDFLLTRGERFVALKLEPATNYTINPETLHGRRAKIFQIPSVPMLFFLYTENPGEAEVHVMHVLSAADLSSFEFVERRKASGD
jgi:hypothetical protein